MEDSLIEQSRQPIKFSEQDLEQKLDELQGKLYARRYKPFERNIIVVGCKECGASFRRLENHPHRAWCDQCQARRIKARCLDVYHRNKVLAPKSKEIQCSKCRTTVTLPWKTKISLCQRCKADREKEFRKSGQWGRDNQLALKWRRNYYQQNRDKILAKAKANAYRANAHQKARYHRLKSTPALFARMMLDKAMASGIRHAIAKNRRSWVALVGYSLNDLISHLSARFQPGMTLENYGQWHIDHIIPKSRFKYQSHEDSEFKKCWDLGNLQPMWAVENMSNGNRDKPLKKYLPGGE